MLKAWRKDFRKIFWGRGNKARHVTIGQVMAEIESCRCLVPMTVWLKHRKTSNSTLAAAQDMKYSQDCQVKMVVDQAINALERAARDGTADAALKKRLAAAYVSRPQKGSRTWLIHREEKQGAAGGMGRGHVLVLEHQRH